MQSKRPLVVYALSIVLVEAAGFVVGMLTRGGVELYATGMNKPPLSPPGIVFPVVWTVLYALMGIALARVVLSEPSDARTWGLAVFALQLALNLAWSFIFFGSQSYGLALLELACMIVVTWAMYLAFRMVDRVAARLQLPYLVWLCFAAYLNTGVLLLN